MLLFSVWESGKAAAFQTMEFHLKRGHYAQRLLNRQTICWGISSTLACHRGTATPHCYMLSIYFPLYPSCASFLFIFICIHTNILLTHLLPHSLSFSLSLLLYWCSCVGMCLQEAPRVGYLGVYRPMWFHLFPQSWEIKSLSVSPPIKKKKKQLHERWVSLNFVCNKFVHMSLPLDLSAFSMKTRPWGLLAFTIQYTHYIVWINSNSKPIIIQSKGTTTSGLLGQVVDTSNFIQQSHHSVIKSS